MEIQYGIQITTAQTTLTDYALGLVDGVLRWVTGRPDIDGWKEGLIKGDTFSPVSQEIEISAGGSYATMSGFNLDLIGSVGGVPTWKRIKDLHLYLIQAEIVFYTIRDGVFTQDWTGRVGDTAADEETFSIRAMDAFRNIHKPHLTIPADIAHFPNVTEEASQKFIPVSFGRVAYAPMLNVGGPGDKTVLVTVSGEDKTLCAARETLEDARTQVNAILAAAGELQIISINRVVALYTAGRAFVDNDSELVGRYLHVIHGGTDQFTKIKRSFATLTDGTDRTYILLEEPLDVTTPFVRWPSSAPSPADMWIFEVVHQSAVLLASYRPIKSFENNDDGQYGLYYWDSESKQYLDIAEARQSISTTDINGTGFPGATALSKTLDSEGAIPAWFRIQPSDVQYVSKLSSSWTGSTTPGDSQTNLFDGNKSTYYLLTGSGSGGQIDFDIFLPADLLTKDFEDLFLLVDLSHKTNNPALVDVLLSLTFTPFDLYGQEASASGLAHIETYYTTASEPDLTTSFVDVDTLPGAYYNEDTNPERFFAYKKAFSLQPILENIKSLGAFPKVRLSFGFGAFSLNYSAQIREIGFVGKKSVTLGATSIYSRQQGEIYGSTWGGRRTAANMIDNPINVAEAVIREYDGRPEVIDTTSFDFAGSPSVGSKRDWIIGNQVDGSKDSYSILKELAIFGFVGIVAKSNGKRAIKDFRSGALPVAYHDESVFLKGSLGSREPTSLANLYNAPRINYAWNPGAQKFDLLLQITKIEEEAFPEESDLDGSGNPLWQSYAIGYNADEYLEAAVNWGFCHLSYQKYGVIQTLPDDMANAYWYPDAEGVWGLPAGQNAAKLYMFLLCRWTAFRKDVITYRLPNTATHAARELLDRVTFNDQLLTGGEDHVGTIVRRAIIPGNGRDREDCIEISLMLDPF